MSINVVKLTTDKIYNNDSKIYNNDNILLLVLKLQKCTYLLKSIFEKILLVLTN